MVWFDCDTLLTLDRSAAKDLDGNIVLGDRKTITELSKVLNNAFGNQWSIPEKNEININNSLIIYFYG